MKDRGVNWAIVAPGQVARDFALALQAVDSANLASVASREPHKAQRFAQEFGFATSAQNFETLLSDPKIDVVYIASPHHLHAEQSIACIRAGKAVVCEKPMTINAAQAQAVFAAAEQAGVFYMEAVWSRFMPTLIEVRDWIDAGRIGEVQAIQADFGFALPFDATHRLYDINLAGGALLDVGFYPITFAQWIMREQPVSISALATIGASGVDERHALALKYSNGVIAALTGAISANTNHDAWVFGSRGRIKVPNFWHSEEALLIKRDRQETYRQPHRVNGYEYEIEEVNRCLMEGVTESPGMTWADSLAVMSIMDDARAQFGLQYPVESVSL